MADLLIIDDDVDSATILAQIMDMQGHAVRIGYDGQEGLRLAKERTPDLVLLDVEMPNLDGPGMAYEMLVHDMGLENVPVILLSGIAGLSTVAETLGTPYFLSKPYRYTEVVNLAARALAESIAPAWPGKSDPSSR